MRTWLLAMLMAVGLPAAADELAVSERPAVQVQGEAEIQVEPDHATLRLHVQHEATQLLDARRRNQAAVEAVFAAAQGLGVSRADLSSTPSMAFPGRWSCANCTDEEKRSGYTARTSITITLRKLGTLMELVDTLSSDASLQLEDVEYRTSALRQHRDQARALAVRAAREKAVALSGELEQSIGRALSISEQNPGGDGPLAPGRIAVRARVAVLFELN